MMTITEKILALAAGKKRVSAGELIEVKLDLVLANDITAPLAIKEFKKVGQKRVFNRRRVVLVMDHFCPAKDIASAEQIKISRQFAQEQRLTHFYDAGQMGIEHALLPEEGLIRPGKCVIGADSHSCTYGALAAFATGVGSTDLAYALATGKIWLKVPSSIKVILKGKPPRWVGGKDVILYLIGKIGVDGALYQTLEFTGPAIQHLSIDDRFIMANMAIEAGAKSGIFPLDKITKNYLKTRLKGKYPSLSSDKNASYSQEITIDLSQLEPQVAFPHLPSNSRPVSQVKKIKIDQVVIGSCTNGRISDLRLAARILARKKVAPFVRCLIIPATQKIYQQAIKEGLVDIFIEAGCVVSTPTCGPCLGGYMGVLGAKEVALSTTNRNFVGRMGHPTSKVYLAGPAVAASSAIKGYIAPPPAN